MSEGSRCFIGLGSNLNHPEQQINAALEALEKLPETHGLQCAPWYRSKAIGPGKQPDYINTVARLWTTLPPLKLLHALQQIENQQGRQRSIRWGARTLDLDLLLYGDHIHNSDELTLPHPQMSLRNFVLWPLFDLAPDLVLPNGDTLADWVNNCDDSGLTRITHSSPTLEQHQ